MSRGRQKDPDNKFERPFYGFKQMTRFCEDKVTGS